MKWENKGHEYDIEGVRLKNIFKKKKGFMIFGAGIIGTEMAKILDYTGCLHGFIDNDRGKQGNELDGHSIISIEDYIQSKRNDLIIIAADAKNIPDIKMQLNRLNMIENTDYFAWDYFHKKAFPILYAYYFNKCYVNIAQISLTERCTLKCKKCAHGCYAVGNNAKDLSLDQAKYSADMFFRLCARVSFNRWGTFIISSVR